MASEKLKPELLTNRDGKAAEAQKAQEQAATPEDRPAQPEVQQVKRKQVTNADVEALDEDGNPRPGPHNTHSGRHTFPGLGLPQRSRELHATPISRSTPKNGEVRESDALIELAYWYKADGPPVTLVEPTDRLDADQFRLEARTRQGFRDDLVLTIWKGRQVHTEIDLNSSVRTYNLILSEHQYRVEVVEMEYGEVCRHLSVMISEFKFLNVDPGLESIRAVAARNHKADVTAYWRLVCTLSRRQACK